MTIYFFLEFVCFFFFRTVMNVTTSRRPSPVCPPTPTPNMVNNDIESLVWKPKKIEKKLNNGCNESNRSVAASNDNCIKNDSNCNNNSSSSNSSGNNTNTS